MTSRILALAFVFLGALFLGPLGGTALAANDCTVDTDCDPMEKCDTTNQTCVPVGESCLNSSECPAGLVCYFGDCVASCGSDSDCGAGMKCQDDACVPADTVSGGGRGEMGCQLAANGRPDGALLGALLVLGLLLAARRRTI